MRFPRVWALGLLLIALVSLTWSQTGTSTIRGTITDPQGRVVSGATVTMTNTGTSATRTTKSTDAGVYVFDLIQPGTYRVDIEARGFKKQSIAKVEALIGKPTEASAQLEVGTTAEVVEVTYDTQVISYHDLLEVFWANHNPTTLNRQGPDVGAQYRSAIFYYSPEQLVEAQGLGLAQAAAVQV